MSLVLPNGVRLEWHGDLGPEQLEALVLTASRLFKIHAISSGLWRFCLLISRAPFHQSSG
jgi:hypothetical protein